MSALRPTPEQRAAIEHALEDACVVAGAGSGKTAVLTQRFVHLVVRHDLPVRRIAALTFTSKAAGEMRERIARALAAVGRLADAEEVEFAPISTIHAFCTRILKLHAVDAELDPAFRVLDETEARLLQEEAFRQACRKLEARGSDAVLVLGRAVVTPEELIVLLERIRGAGRTPRDIAWFAGAPYEATLGAEVERAVAALLAQASDLAPPLAARVQAAAYEARAALALGPDATGRLAAAIAAALAARPEGKKLGPRPFQLARKALLDTLEGYRGARLDALGRVDVLPLLQELLVEYAESYGSRRRELGALDFTDLETEALRLLDRLHAEGRPLAHAPRALLVDEMQDTNPMQARLLARLCGPRAPSFCVGDPKQSIYRFRRADVRVLQAERRRVGEAGEHVLAATFRARPGLVAVLNELTARLFAGGQAGVEAEPLRAEGRFRAGEGPDAELVVIDAGAAVGAGERRREEARWIARQIRELVEGGAWRAKIESGPDGGDLPPRRLHYGDVAILLRARNDLTTYEEALAAERIPFATNRGRGYFQADEVVDLVHALRVIHDPADDHALAALLTGPAGAASDEDLLAVFPDPAQGPRVPGRAWQTLRARAREGDGHARLVHTVEALRLEASAGRLGRVVEGVLHDLGLLEVVLLRGDGARRAMNLRKGLQIARDLEAKGRYGLGELLQHLATLRDLEVPEGEAAMAGLGEDVVRINTVHGAKGLEYPVVFLADAGRRRPSIRGGLLYDGDVGLAVRLRDPLEGETLDPGAWKALKRQEEALQEQEDRRLLYVAMTRAEERLFITTSAAGTAKTGLPKGVAGWGRALLEVLGAEPRPQGLDLTLGAGVLRLRSVDPLPDPPLAPVPLRMEAPTAEGRARAVACLEAAARPVAPLGATPFVVSVSDLLAYERSPARLWHRRLEPRTTTSHMPSEPDDPASGSEPEDSREARRRDAYERFDETHETSDAGPDRMALGRALHTLLEHGVAAHAPDEVFERVLAEELGRVTWPGAATHLRQMVGRFEASATGRLLAAQDESELSVRREVAFHARIRFPRGERVAGFDALLVRGAIDLWLEDAAGRVVLVDYKTNAPSALLATPQAVADCYAVQLRLYALAAERLMGRDVSGARLLLVDPAWGEEPCEVAVDVAGPALEDARRLCRAYALSCLEDRWPRTWQEVLEG